MESSNDIGQIGDNYTIKEELDFGYSSRVYLVIDKNTNEDYVAKVFLEKGKHLFEQEVNILNILKEENNPYIVKIIESGEGEIIRKNEETIIAKYIIMEYALYGNIHDYIYAKGTGLGELYSKLIFSKIMEGIIICHKNNICNRDLKLDNILLNANFIPKICDFGFACINAKNLKDNLGTEYYKPLEIIENKPYDGIKVDIFSLGMALMLLTKGIYGFKMKSNKNLGHYRLIKDKDKGEESIKTYWKIIDSNNVGITLSDEFKKLFLKMVDYDPELRPSAEDILNDDWFKEINELKKDENKLLEIEGEIREIFINFADQVKKHNKKRIEAKKKIYKKKDIKLK